jgi:hypothetical protein
MNPQKEKILDQLAGAWRLLSSEFRTSDGAVVYPLGEDAAGQCILTSDGYMSGQLMRKDRPNFAGGNQASGTPEEIKAALEGYVSYYGHFDIDPDRQQLTTHVEGSLFPNWIGEEQVRFYELSENRLTLKTPPIPLGDDEITGYLIWERR